MGPSNGCWIDVFDQERFQGQMRRLYGPGDFGGLRIRERDWGDMIRSVTVGPAAYVQCYRWDDFEGTVFWMLPNQAMETIAEKDVPEGADSIRLYDRPPFAHEKGYAAYMLWAASQLARVKG